MELEGPAEVTNRWCSAGRLLSSGKKVRSGEAAHGAVFLLAHVAVGGV